MKEAEKFGARRGHHPEHAIKAKNSCMPMRVVIEPAPGTQD